VTVTGRAMVRKMRLEWRIIADARGLKIPCSTTELLAQAQTRVYPMRAWSSTLFATL
jgi:hypothetical protein